MTWSRRADHHLPPRNKTSRETLKTLSYTQQKFELTSHSRLPFY
jgi:hypothetical protein